jgi:hypothetical protein
MPGGEPTVVKRGTLNARVSPEARCVIAPYSDFDAALKVVIESGGNAGIRCVADAVVGWNSARRVKEETAAFKTLVEEQTNRLSGHIIGPNGLLERSDSV